MVKAPNAEGTRQMWLIFGIAFFSAYLGWSEAHGVTTKSQLASVHVALCYVHPPAIASRPNSCEPIDKGRLVRFGGDGRPIGDASNYDKIYPFTPIYGPGTSRRRPYICLWHEKRYEMDGWMRAGENHVSYLARNICPFLGHQFQGGSD